MVTSRTKSRSVRSTHASRKNRQSRSRHATSRRASRGHSRKHSRGHSRGHSRSRKSKSRKHARKSRRMHGGGVSSLEVKQKLREQYNKALEKMKTIAYNETGKWKAYRVKDGAMVKRLSTILNELMSKIKRAKKSARTPSSSNNQLLR